MYSSHFWPPVKERGAGSEGRGARGGERGAGSEGRGARGGERGAGSEGREKATVAKNWGLTGFFHHRGTEGTEFTREGGNRSTTCR
jgi:hypothetical protein